MRHNLYQSNSWDRVLESFAAGTTARLSRAFKLEQDNVFGLLLGTMTAGGTVIFRLAVSDAEAGTYYAAKDQDGTAVSVTIADTNSDKLIVLGLWEPNPDYPWAKLQVDPETQNSEIDGVWRAGGQLRKYPATNGDYFSGGSQFRGITLGSAI